MFCGQVFHIKLFTITNTLVYMNFGPSAVNASKLFTFSHWVDNKMEQFSKIFTPPESPNSEYNPRENVLNQIREMDDAHETERWEAYPRHFINQLNDVDMGHLSIANETEDAQGAVDGLPPPTPPPQPWQDQVHIVNEYNSFNLANITPPIAPKWKQPDNLLEEFHKFKHSCMRIFDRPGVTSPVAKWKQICYWFGLILTVRIYMIALICNQTKPMMLTMSYWDLKNSVSQSVILGQPNKSSLRSPTARQSHRHLL